jgi:hypothetical protein
LVGGLKTREGRALPARGCNRHTHRLRRSQISDRKHRENKDFLACRRLATRALQELQIAAASAAATRPNHPAAPLPTRRAAASLASDGSQPSAEKTPRRAEPNSARHSLQI